MLRNHFIRSCTITESKIAKIKARVTACKEVGKENTHMLSVLWRDFDWQDLVG